MSDGSVQRRWREGCGVGWLSLVARLKSKPWLSFGLILVGIDITGTLVVFSPAHAGWYAQSIYVPLVLAAAAFGVAGGLLCGLLGGMVIGPTSDFVSYGAGVIDGSHVLAWSLHALWLMGVGLFVALLAHGEGSGRALFKAGSDGGRDAGLPDLEAARKHFKRMSREGAGVHGDSDVVVAALQISNFDDLIRTFGYHRADAIMRAVAKQIAESVPRGAFVSKASRNTFAIVDRAGDREGDDEFWQRIGELDQRPLEMDGVPIFVDTVTGVARGSRAESNLDQLLSNAESAALDAYGEGKPFGRYDPQGEEKRSDGLRLLGEFHRGLRNGEVYLEYQPKLAIHERRFVGLEALARWQHPVRGLIGPGKFIPLIERTRAIDWFTRWALTEAVRQIAKWRSRGYEPSVAVNISTRNLLNTSLLRYIQDLLSEHRVPLHCLELEISERALADLHGARVDLLRDLHGAGVRVAVDNFGTGHASFAYLGSLPLDILKLDRRFIKALIGQRRESAIAKRTIQMAHDLGLEVVGEGVESGEQLRALSALGCDYGQGFFIARPLAPDRVVSILSSDWHEHDSATNQEAG